MPTALVTGANRGLGLETSRQLMLAGWDVYVAARQLESARSALAELGDIQDRARPIEIDVTQSGSIESAVSAVRDRGPLDALVNNAGVSLDGFDADVAARTLDVNFRGAMRVSDAFLPLLSPTANVVMVSSGMGELGHVTAPLRQRLLDPKLDRDTILALADGFIARVEGSSRDGDGFPNNAYSVSKVLLNAFTRIFAREQAGTGRHVNAICPGWARTRMGGSAAPRSAERAARGIVWGATLGPNAPTGGFFRDEKPIEW